MLISIFSVENTTKSPNFKCRLVYTTGMVKKGRKAFEKILRKAGAQ